MPNLCRPKALFGVMVAVEVVVLVNFLLRLPETPASWSGLSTSSLFAQWLALLCAITLCKLRSGIDRMPRLFGVALALSLPVIITGIGTWLVMRLDQELGFDLTVEAPDAARFIAAHMTVALLLTVAMLRYLYVIDQWRRQVAAQAQAQVEALQARIRPHFLFNSMNSIASLIRHDPVTAERAVEDLSELFRAALGSDSGESTLGDELHLVERYLAIEALRLGPRLRIEWDIAEDLPRDLSLPRLILQPLVENAIVHGIAKLKQGGVIHIVLRRDNTQCRFEVRNPLPKDNSPAHGNQHAHESITQRLAHRFGSRARMAAEVQDGYYVASLIVPVDTE